MNTQANTVVVTGAAGFIGANIIKGLNARGITNIIAVDDLTQGDKFQNLVDLKIADYVDASVFYEKFAARGYGKIEAVFHEGACSDTMEQNGKFMMDNNYRVSCDLFVTCQTHGTRLLYASSAATYGGSDTFIEEPAYERPLNVYGYSKLLFDQRLRHVIGEKFEKTTSQVVGFRYFNVYGDREQHKGRMASVAFHQFHKFKEQGHVRLFGAYGGYAAGMQQRDFVYIDDVVAVNLWFFDNPGKSGLFNLGTGRAQPFNDIAHTVVNTLRHQVNKESLTLSDMVDMQMIQYIPFPEALVGKYQCHTQADLTALRASGCNHVFANVQTGVSSYTQQLASK
jgi:ADP-L-glycero-D-manno-heptose 6-epimerase